VQHSVVINFAYNATEARSTATTIDLFWIAKGIENANTIFINGSQVGSTPDTNTDGSFTEQIIITLDAAGVLNVGAYEIVIGSVLTGTGTDIDDFEFVLIGLE